MIGKIDASLAHKCSERCGFNNAVCLKNSSPSLQLRAVGWLYVYNCSDFSSFEKKGLFGFWIFSSLRLPVTVVKSVKFNVTAAEVQNERKNMLVIGACQSLQRSLDCG